MAYLHSKSACIRLCWSVVGAALTYTNPLGMSMAPIIMTSIRIETTIILWLNWTRRLYFIKPFFTRFPFTTRMKYMFKAASMSRYSIFSMRSQIVLIRIHLGYINTAERPNEKRFYLGLTWRLAGIQMTKTLMVIKLTTTEVPIIRCWPLSLLCRMSRIRLMMICGKSWIWMVQNTTAHSKLDTLGKFCNILTDGHEEVKARADVSQQI